MPNRDWTQAADARINVAQREAALPAAHHSDAPREDALNCAVCGRLAQSTFVVKSYRYFRCTWCDFTFIDPAAARTYSSERVFTDAYFRGDGGAGYVDYFDEGALLQAHGQRYARLPALSRRPMHVLDVGCAAGFTLRGFIDAGCTGVGIEPNASMAAYAAEHLDLDVRRTNLENFDTSERFDLIVLLQVVDHLEDIHAALQRVAALLTPGGLCLIEFDDCRSVVARVFASMWHGYAPPSVQRVFSPRSLALLLGRYHLSLQSHGYATKFLRLDHALAVLRYRLERWLSPPIVARLTAILPRHVRVRYVGDDIKWAVFRKAEVD